MTDPVSDTAAGSTEPRHGTESPSPWVTRWLHGLPAGARVLDFACGSGRHARWVAARGARVVATDRDAEALSGLIEAGIERVATDLEAAPWPAGAGWAGGFDAVVCTNYLFRPRLDLLAACLGPSGVLVYETFARGNEQYGRPRNPDFLLAPGELLALAARAGLHVVAYEDGFVSQPRAARVQRLCARRAGLAPEALPLA